MHPQFIRGLTKYLKGILLTIVLVVSTIATFFTDGICDDKFSENDLGLQRGIIGNTLVSLCPMCFKGMMNLADYINNRTPIEE